MTVWDFTAAGGMTCGAVLATLGLLGIAAARVRRWREHHRDRADDWTAVADAVGVTDQPTPTDVEAASAHADQVREHARRHRREGRHRGVPRLSPSDPAIPATVA